MKKDLITDKMWMGAIVIVLIVIIGPVVGYIIVTSQSVNTDTTALEQRISQLEGKVSIFQDQIQEKEDQIQEKDSQISNLTLQIAELEQLIPPLTKGEWNTIKTFTGSVDRTTELFYVPSGTWRINWTYTTAEYRTTLFFLKVYPEGETIYSIESVITSGLSQSDVTYVYEGPGSFYIEFTTGSYMQSYTVIIQAYIQD